MELDSNFDSFSDVADEIAMPPKYKVVFLNDDFTPMNFVVTVLVEIFHKGAAEAEALMRNIHQSGRGVAGVYVYDIAETKAQETMQRAREQGFPLKCVLEKE